MVVISLLHFLRRDSYETIESRMTGHSMPKMGERRYEIENFIYPGNHGF